MNVAVDEFTSALIILKAASSSPRSYDIKGQNQVRSSLKIKSSVIYSLCLFNGRNKKAKNDAFMAHFPVICTAYINVMRKLLKKKKSCSSFSVCGGIHQSKEQESIKIKT